MTYKNIFYAQSGGVTPVINASAAGVIATARQYPDRLGRVLVGVNGIIGALKEELWDASQLSEESIQQLIKTPSGAFGSCRYKLQSLDKQAAEYQRLIEVFKAHQIGYFFYNGGGDSQDTTHKVAQMAQKMDYPLVCIGIPKTIDNDLPLTDTCPGFGSVAKYIAVSTLEASLDVASMAASSTKVFILEVMGRHAGWIAAASALAQTQAGDPPHLILCPEQVFDWTQFLKMVHYTVETKGYCVVVASEGIKNAQGQFLAESGLKDAFGHAQLGGVAPVLAAGIKQHLGYKYHWAVSDYLQRAARHLASRVDVEQAYAVGKAAVEFALAGHQAVMSAIVRVSEDPYQWEVQAVPLEQVANQEKKMPKDYFTADGFQITEKARRYLQPLIQGEDYPTYLSAGIPQYLRLDLSKRVSKKLDVFAL